LARPEVKAFVAKRRSRARPASFIDRQLSGSLTSWAANEGPGGLGTRFFRIVGECDTGVHGLMGADQSNRGGNPDFLARQQAGTIASTEKKTSVPFCARARAAEAQSR